MQTAELCILHYFSYMFPWMTSVFDLCIHSLSNLSAFIVWPLQVTLIVITSRSTSHMQECRDSQGNVGEFHSVLRGYVWWHLITQQLIMRCP